MVQFLSIIFFLGFLQFLLGFSKVPVFLCHPVEESVLEPRQDSRASVIAVTLLTYLADTGFESRLRYPLSGLRYFLAVPNLCCITNTPPMMFKYIYLYFYILVDFNIQNTTFCKRFCFPSYGVIQI